jgi:hypothetical protein
MSIFCSWLEEFAVSPYHIEVKDRIYAKIAIAA